MIFTTWTVASQFLVANPGGDFNGFIPFYMAEEERMLAEAQHAFEPEATANPGASSSVPPPPPPESTYEDPTPPPTA